MLHACGITSFLTRLPKCSAAHRDGCMDAGTREARRVASSWCATGDIKVVPEDFVVVEVDPTGQRTDTHSYVFPAVDALNAAAPAPGESAKEAADMGGDEGDVAQELEGSTDGLSFQCRVATPSARSLLDLHRLLNDHAAALLKVVGSSAQVAENVCSTFTQADLTALVRDLQLTAQGALPSSSLQPTNDEAATTAAPSISATTCWWRGSHCLGEFIEKKERQMMHVLVRRCFPHVRSYAEIPTATAAPSSSLPSRADAAASVIYCTLDLHYALFCATLGAEAAMCIARWALAAQTARSERCLDEVSSREIQLVTPVEDIVVPASVDKGVCFASFDPLAEAMRRPLVKPLPDDLDTEGLREDKAVASSFSDGEHMPLLSDKDVRRHVHDTIRRFYPFIKCQVRDGQVVLRCTPKRAPKNTADDALLSGGSVLLGVRRPREAEAETTTTDGNAGLASGATSGFIHFVVKKRNLDTAEMRQLVAEYCGLKDDVVRAAGMKDKKAVTTQRCSIPNTATSTRAQEGCRPLAAATPASPVVLRWPADPQNSYAAVLCASLCSGPVHIGQLKGNWFSVQVRNVRWATPGEGQGWEGGITTTVAPPPADVGITPVSAEDDNALCAFLEERFRQCVECGFINYFGQQRFGETVERADDHTGVHLFAGRWVDAVKSLFRSCPHTYDAFPERMEARFVPSNLRDAQVMTHALRQTYRICFSEHPLTREDVQTSSVLWTRLCEKAITEGVPYYLRSLWVHAGQSVFFNLSASFIVDGMERPLPLTSAYDEGHPVKTRCRAGDADSLCNPTSAPVTSATAVHGLPQLSFATVATASLPLGGYQVLQPTSEGKGGGEESNASWQAWKAAAIAYALRNLRWTTAQAFEQRKVAGVPVPGSWRAVVVRPQNAALAWVAREEGCANAQPFRTPALSSTPALPAMRLSFTLPSSAYATIFLREVLGCDKWW
ncbi:hypothetical protein ABL78_5712 [Leptomonas seymouri]|uniref:TRUD domain-containing protein n=1 Tax=Leptomonas seymouri TaxID=5684 RepID=A0A0N0P4F4_LEPSE|nr:hypothetical protein ABL78_5712 [Leptomonas seymouri]|eukprot:KPI85229.1 hypothetical protein ABL78_5712 [Leptomonas seymouri]